MDSMRELIAAELRATLARHRVSAAALARRLGWSQTYMARRVDGRAEPTISELQKIAEGLGVCLVELLPREALQKRDGTIAQSSSPAVRRRRVTARPTPASAARPPARPVGTPTRPPAAARAVRIQAA